MNADNGEKNLAHGIGYIFMLFILLLFSIYFNQFEWAMIMIGSFGLGMMASYQLVLYITKKGYWF